MNFRETTTFALSAIKSLRALLPISDAVESVIGSNKSKLTAFEELRAAVEAKGMRPLDIASAARSENWLNRGTQSEVYKIPELPDYVLKVDARNAIDPYKASLRELEDFAPGHNFGQPIAGLAYRAQILRRVSGTPHGYSHWVQEQLEPPEIAKLHQSAIEFAAQMPTEAFRGFAANLKTANSLALRFDPVNPHNTLVDATTKRFNIVDLERDHRRRNRGVDMLSSLAYAPPDYVNRYLKDGLSDAYKSLLDKTMEATRVEKLQMTHPESISVRQFTQRSGMSVRDGEAYLRNWGLTR